jgi:hypothetical protein
MKLLDHLPEALAEASLLWVEDSPNLLSGLQQVVEASSLRVWEPLEFPSSKSVAQALLALTLERTRLERRIVYVGFLEALLLTDTTGEVALTLNQVISSQEAKSYCVVAPLTSQRHVKKRYPFLFSQASVLNPNSQEN